MSKHLNQSYLNDLYAQQQRQLDMRQYDYSGMLDNNPGAMINANQIDWNNRTLIKETKKEEKSMFRSFREYISRHSDIIFTVVLVMLADRWFFKGALKSSVQGLAHKLIAKADAKLSE